MTSIAADARPRLAPGCRLRESELETMLLFPEGMLRLKGTGAAILKRCDGTRTYAEIVAELQREFDSAPADAITRETEAFLVRLQEKRVVDF